MPFDTSQSVHALKMLIQQMTGMKSDMKELRVADVVLQDERTLSWYAPHEGIA